MDSDRTDGCQLCQFFTDIGTFMSIPVHIQQILNKKSTEVAQGEKANCFWATQYFFEPQLFPPTNLNGNEILKFIAESFSQLDSPNTNDVFVIWSSSDTNLSPDKIDVHYLATYPEGFPFGLVVEHSGIILDNGQVFQKASPSEDDRFEIIELSKAFAPYEKLPWVRTTYHKKKVRR